jgi:hypothetical protein
MPLCPSLAIAGVIDWRNGLDLARALRQPVRQIRGRLKIQKGIGQGFNIAQWQALKAVYLFGGQGAKALRKPSLRKPALRDGGSL